MGGGINLESEEKGPKGGIGQFRFGDRVEGKVSLEPGVVSRWNEIEEEEGEVCGVSPLHHTRFPSTTQPDLMSLS